MVAFQNVSCFVFEQGMVFHNAAVQIIYNVFHDLMCIFNAIKKKTYIHSLYTVEELHTNFVLIHFGRQPLCDSM